MSSYTLQLFLVIFLVVDAVVLPAPCCDKATEEGRRWSRSDDPNPLEALVMQQSQMIDQLQAEMTAVKARLDQQETTVAFNARLSVNSPFTDRNILVFDLVDLNLGGGYDRVTGLFTASISGLYQFSFKITHTPPGRIHARLSKGGTEIAEVESIGNEMDRSSATVAVQLTAGDRVWVEKITGDSNQVEGEWRSSFTGILIQPALS